MNGGFQGEQILVTGATGFIGRVLVPALTARGAAVRALTRDPAHAAPLAAAGAEIVQGALEDVASLRRAIQGCHSVVHLAALVGAEPVPLARWRAVNVDGTRHLAEVALETRVERLLYVSTVAVYGMAAGPGTHEASPHQWSGEPYTDTKIEAEALIRRLVRERGLPAVIVQPSEVYGPGPSVWTTGPIQLIRAGKLILVDGGRGVIQPIYVDDLVEGMLAALGRGVVGEAYILCGPAPVTVGDFFGRYVQLLGAKPLRSVPRPVAMAIAALMEWAARLTGRPPAFTRNAVRFVTRQATYDGSKARRELGFQPRTTLEDGMQQIGRWLAQPAR